MADLFDPNDPVHRTMASLGALARTGNTFNSRAGLMRDHAIQEDRSRDMFAQMLEMDRSAYSMTDTLMRAFNGGRSISPESDDFRRLHALVGYTMNTDMISGLTGRGNLFNVGLGSQMISRMSGATTLDSAAEQQVTNAIFNSASEYFQSPVSGFSDQVKSYGLNFTELGNLQTMLAVSGGFTGSLQGALDDSGEFQLSSDFESKMNSRLSTMAETVATLKNVFGGQPMQDLIARAEEITGLNVGSVMDENVLNQRLQDIQSVGRANGMTNAQALMELEAGIISNYERMGISRRMGGSLASAARSRNYGMYNAGEEVSNAFQAEGRYMNVQSLEHTTALTQADQAALLEQDELFTLTGYAVENTFFGEPELQQEALRLRQRAATASSPEERSAREMDLYNFLSREMGANPYDVVESMGGVGAISNSLSATAQERIAKDSLLKLDSLQRDQLQRRMYTDTGGSSAGREMVDQLLSMDRSSSGRLSRSLANLGRGATPAQIEQAAREFFYTTGENGEQILRDQIFFEDGADAETVIGALSGFAGEGGIVSNTAFNLQYQLNRDDMSNRMGQADRRKLASRELRERMNSAESLYGEYSLNLVGSYVRSLLGEDRAVTREDLVGEFILADNLDTSLQPGARRMQEALTKESGAFSFVQGAAEARDMRRMEESMTPAQKESLNKFYSQMNIDPTSPNRFEQMASKLNAEGGEGAMSLTRFDTFLGQQGFTSRAMADGDASVLGYASEAYLLRMGERKNTALKKSLEVEDITSEFGSSKELNTMIRKAMSGSPDAVNSLADFLSSSGNFVTDKEEESASQALAAVIQEKTQAYEEEKEKGKEADKGFLKELVSEIKALREAKAKSSTDEYMGKMTVIEGDDLILEVFRKTAIMSED